MGTARRLYLYLVSGVGLALVVGGAITMLRLLLAHAAAGAFPPASVFGPSVQLGFDPDREALSGAIAMMAVGIPLWLIHWALVQRMTAGDGEDAAAERASIVRSAYFGLVMIYLLVAGAGALVVFLREGFARTLGAQDPFGFVSLSDSASTAVIYLAAWLAHAWWRAQDLRGGRPLQSAAAWIGRLYLYGAALVALVAALGAASGLIGTTIDIAAGHVDNAFPTIYGNVPPAVGFYGQNVPFVPQAAVWWVRPILSMLVQLVVWAPLWALHWLYSVRLTAGDEPQARSERASRVRLTFFIAVVAIGVGYLVWGLGQGLAVALGAVAGVGTWAGSGPLWRDVAVPLATALPLALAWWWHRRRVLLEGDSSDWPDTPARAIGYLTAFIGVGAFAYGLATGVGLILQRLSETASSDAYLLEGWRWQAVQGIALAAVALPIWLWPWLALRRRLRLDHAAEAGSTARRAYLFGVIGLTILAMAAATASIVFRVTRLALGLQASSVGSEIGYAVATLFITAPLLAYHLAALRADLALSGESAVAVAVEAGASGVSATPATQELVIVGPPGVNLDALKASLAARLPDGYSIRVRASDDTPAP